ncbi:unnamed protein product [Cochlearia groenlandica]
MMKHPKPYMESGVHRSHCFDILEGMPPQDDDFNSAFLQNTDFHVQMHPISLNRINSNRSQLDPDAENMYHEEKRARRIVSNRESARRLRMRKKKQIEELQQQVEHFMILNHHLSEKVINLLEINHQILQENSQLREKVSSFHLIMADMLVVPARNVDESINDRDVDHLRGETTKRTNTFFDCLNYSVRGRERAESAVACGEEECTAELRAEFA